MTERTYPYKAWVLQPSLKPVEVELIGPYKYNRQGVDHGDETSGGKLYRLEELYPNKEAAIAAGREAITRIEADLAKRTENLNKKRAALDKAEKQ